MPMIDALWPEDALILKRKHVWSTNFKAEGYDPANPIARSVTVLHLHRAAAIYVGGERSKAIRYRIIPSAPGLKGNTRRNRAEHSSRR
jgi:hypothetical protein